MFINSINQLQVVKNEVLFNSYEKETKRQNSVSNITASLPAELKYRCTMRCDQFHGTTIHQHIKGMKNGVEWVTLAFSSCIHNFDSTFGGTEHIILHLY
jgi:hypothetical protein